MLYTHWQTEWFNITLLMYKFLKQKCCTTELCSIYIATGTPAIGAASFATDTSPDRAIPYSYVQNKEFHGCAQ